MKNSKLNELFSDAATTIHADYDLNLATTSNPTVQSATVLNIDKWGMRKGQELAEEWRSNADNELCNIASEVVCDAHASLFEPKPSLAQNPKDKVRAKWWEQLMQSADYGALRAHTTLNPMLSSIGAAELCKQWIQYEQECRQTNNQSGNSQGGGSKGPGQDEEIRQMQSTNKAAAAARNSVQTAKNVAEALGIGIGDTKSASRLEEQSLAEAFHKVRNCKLLHSIFSLAGKLRARCRSLQRQKMISDSADITGIELDGQIRKLIPSELAQVAGIPPELQTLALYRLAQRRMLCYQQHAKQPVASGPIVVCVDESGSMEGDNIITAKAIALTMAWLARHQNRWCALIGFSSGIQHNCITIDPSRRNDGQVLNWAEHFFKGGTTLDVPLYLLRAKLWKQFQKEGMPRGKTDVIIITDDCVDCEEELRKKYRDWAKNEQVTTYGIIISSHPGKLAMACDKYWCVKSAADLHTESSPIETILSI